MEQKKILISLVVLLIIAGLIGTWFYTRDTLPKTIRIASGSKGGEYYQIGEELEKKLIFRTRRSVENRETVGTLENLRMLKEGKVELALLTQATIFPELDHKGVEK
ncbi:MAG: hypothetical protein D3903_04825 [Candidatus Electrothrix sp. GM3_4]|nr:hypothetical protein [Candidatus Electrothrix sp. GM3_4]